MVPVLATGWNDIQKRVQAMNQTASVHQERVRELNAALANLNRQTALSASVRLAALQAHLQQLSQRLLHLAAQAPAYAPPQSSAFRPEEGEMKHTLEGVKDALDGRVRSHTKSGAVGLAVAPRSQNRGRMLGQINELWGAVEEVRRQRRARGDTSWAGDERMLAELAGVLEQQQTALGKLSELASNAVFDADVVRQGLAAIEGRK
jgi:nuclear pore complex protein Nup54